MRTCEKNKTTIWYSNTKSETDMIDDGNYTGEIVEVYTDVKEAKIQLYPSTGQITAQTFGLDEVPQYMSISEFPLFTQDTVIFLKKPESNSILANSYDLRVVGIKKSQNFYNYALKRR